MNDKIQLISTLANMPDTDPRLARLAAILDGTPIDETATCRLLTMGAACERLNLSRTTLWRLIQEKRIATVETRRGNFRVPESELYRFAKG